MLEIVAYYFLSTCDLDLWPQLYKNRVLSTSSILYDIELTNSECG